MIENQNLLGIAPPPEYVVTRRRPSKLTAELIEEFKRVMPNCFFIKTAAGILGIDHSTLNEWVRRGKRESARMAAEESNLCRRSEYLYYEFSLAHEEILALTESKSIANIRAAGNAGIWQADVWQLERRFPQRYSVNKKEIRELVKVAELQAKQIDKLQEEINQLMAKLQATVGSPTFS